MIARSTVTAMKGGIIYGFVGQVEEIVRRMRGELGGTATVVATGGWAEVIFDECRCFDHYDPLLTLEGLRIIHERNRTPDAADRSASKVPAPQSGSRPPRQDSP